MYKNNEKQTKTNLHNNAYSSPFTDWRSCALVARWR